jgi:hypothetical protein
MSVPEASPLSRLIGRHKGGRSYPELEEASGGVVSASDWEELELGSMWGRRPMDPVIVEAIALALGLRGSTVRHFELAGLGLPTPAAPNSSQGWLRSGGAGRVGTS